jgi:hypothetical protein
MSGCCCRSCDSNTQMRHLILAAQTALIHMPLSSPVSRRTLKHTRAIQVEAFLRDDGLWDIDARITDTKTNDLPLVAGVRPAGESLHDLRLRVTINAEMTIVEAAAASDAVPYPGYCNTIGPAYETLVGLNLMSGFRRGLTERLGGSAGCTHLTELAQILPTVAIQAFAGENYSNGDRAESDNQDQRPFQLDRCHALRTDGAAVAKYYPRWAMKSSGGFQSS